MKIIDAHLHIGRFKTDIYSNKKRSDSYTDDLRVGVISSITGVIKNQKEVNKEMSRFIKPFRYSLRGLIWINPYDPEWEKDAREYANSKSYVGIKIHPSLNNYQPLCKLLDPIFEFSQKYRLPVVIHTSRAAHCSASKFVQFMRKFPNVTLLLYHMQPLNEAIELATRFKNVFLGTSGRNIEEVKRAVSKCGSRKVVFGSDEHLIYNKTKPYNLLSEIQGAFNQKGRENILYNNAKKIFNLE